MTVKRFFTGTEKPKQEGIRRVIDPSPITEHAGGLSLNRYRSLDNFAWSNKQAQVITQLTCVVPTHIRNIIRTINTIFPTQEFSIFLKSTIDNASRRVIINPDSWYIPKQKVTGWSVEYLEDNGEYNTVMHKHLQGIRCFSGTDMTWINQNFTASILWVNDEFPVGLINIPSEIGRIQIPLRMVEETIPFVVDGIEEVAKDKINMFTPPTKFVPENDALLLSGKGFGKFSFQDDFGWRHDDGYTDKLEDNDYQEVNDLDFIEDDDEVYRDPQGIVYTKEDLDEIFLDKSGTQENIEQNKSG